jgi:hypothetical protein
MADELLPDSLFSGLYSPIGRPPISPSALTRVLLLQLKEGRSDRQAVDDLNYDVRWQYMCDLGVDECDFHPTVLTYFRLRLLYGTVDRERIAGIKAQSGDPLLQSPAMGIVKQMLEFAVTVGILDRERAQGIDSTAILGAAQIQDCFRLIFQGIRQTLQAHAKAAPEQHAALLGQLRRSEYLSAGHTKPVIEWTDKDAREALLAEYVLDTATLQAACEGIEDEELQASLKELLGLIDQDLLVAASGQVTIKKEVAPNRQCSVVDKEMRHGRKSRSKRFNGFKAHVMVEPESELITAVTVTTASTHDGQAAATLLEQSQPAVVVGDNAYAGLEVREQALAQGTAIITPTAPLQEPETATAVIAGEGSEGNAEAAAEATVSEGGENTPEAEAAATVSSAAEGTPEAEAAAAVKPAAEGEGATEPGAATERPATLDKDLFQLDAIARTVTCPNQVTVKLRPSGKARFPVAKCRECPLRGQCTSGKKGRELDIRRGEPLARNLRAYARTEKGRVLVRAIRPATERIIGQLVRCGIRHARYYGRLKTGLQTVLGVIAHNMDKIGRRWLSGKAGGAPGKAGGASTAANGRLQGPLVGLQRLLRPYKCVGASYLARWVSAPTPTRNCSRPLKTAPLTAAS